MSEAMLTSIGNALRNGKPELALIESKMLCEHSGATRETGIEVAKAAATVYRELISPPVVSFVELAASELPSEVGLLVQKALQRLFKMTDEWEEKLWGVHTERLVRQIRDWVRGHHFQSAASNVARLMALVPPDQHLRRANYVGSILATLMNHQKEAQDFIAFLGRRPQDYYLDPNLVSTMEAARAKRASEMAGMNIENIEREFSSAITQVAVDIKNLLPDSSKMGDPEEAVLRDVGDVFRSLLRVPLLREDPDLFLDVTAIFIEFLPREQTATAKVARIEGRTYNTLGFTAKKAIQLTLMDIGKNQFFTRIYAAWAKDFKDTEAIKNIVEFMGALRSPEFNDFLQGLKGNKKANEFLGNQVNQALGSMAGAEAADSLMGDLRNLLTRKRIESSDLKEAERIVASLGNIVKSPRTTTDERLKIIEFLRTHVPEDLSRLAYYTALQAFTFKLDEQTAQQRQWAVKVLTRGLWLADNTTAHQKGGERQASELGFRAEIVEGLIKVGSKEAHTLIRTVEPLSARYGAAYMAVCEVFEKVNDPECLPLLERMLNNTLLHEDSATSNYQQEFYWDAATQQRKPITKDKILSPIVYTIGTIGGPRSLEILKRYQESIAIGKVANPSPEVATFMQRFLGNSAFGGIGAATPGEDGEEGQAAPLDPTEVRRLMGVLTAFYFLTGKEKRRMKKIEALAMLARANSPESLPAIFKQLVDKDTMVVSSAIMCLAELAMPSREKMIRDMVVNTTLDNLESKDPAMRQGAVKVLKEIGPNRKDVRDKIVGYIKQVSRPEVKDAINRLLKTGAGAPPPGEASTPDAGDTTKSGGPPDMVRMLEMKKQYMQARKNWIDGGKKGDPPPKPPGME